MSSPDRVTFHAFEPMLEFRAAIVVVVVSQSQLLNIIIKIDVTVVQFIIRASVRVSENDVDVDVMDAMMWEEQILIMCV